MMVRRLPPGGSIVVSTFPWESLYTWTPPSDPSTWFKRSLALGCSDPRSSDARSRLGHIVPMMRTTKTMIQDMDHYTDDCEICEIIEAEPPREAPADRLVWWNGG